MQLPPPTNLFSFRTAGAIYLAIIVLGLFGEGFVRASLVVNGDAATTARNIIDSELAWRIGIATDLLMHVLDVPLLIFFYLLLKPISQPLALLATAFNIIQTCVLAINKLSLVAALSLLASPVLAGLEGGPGALALVAINLHGHGFGIGLVFFGFTCLVRGFLLLRSDQVPRALGALQLLAGLCYLVNSFALLVFPLLASMLFPAVLLPALVAELALSLWLLLAKERALERKLTEGPVPSSA